MGDQQSYASRLLRLRLKSEDWARRRKMNRFMQLARLVPAMMCGPDARARHLTNYLVAAHPSSFQKFLLPRAMRAAVEAVYPVQPHAALQRAIILKPPISAAERGVVLISFETELQLLLSLQSFAAFEQEYMIVFMPTWQPAWSPALLRLATVATCPFIVLPASPADQEELGEQLGPLCKAMPFQASNWVSQKQFLPRSEKDIDLLMIAVFGKYKRHWLLFDALRQMSPLPRVVVAGRNWEGRTRETLLNEAAAFGVADAIDVRTDVPQREIPDLFARSRLFLAMSHKEGSFIAIAEALMANTPVLAFEDALIGSKAFINENTGFLMNRDRPLGPQLTSALSRADHLKPRQWAVDHISAETSSALFNTRLKRLSQECGGPWTREIVPFHSRNLNFYYLDDRDAGDFAPEYERLRAHHGLVFPSRGEAVR